jgi:hypothetical protein
MPFNFLAKHSSATAPALICLQDNYININCYGAEIKLSIFIFSCRYLAGKFFNFKKTL